VLEARRPGGSSTGRRANAAIAWAIVVFGVQIHDTVQSGDEQEGGVAVTQAVGLSPEAERLRSALVAELLASGSIVTAEVEAAFRRVARHAFAPEVSLEEAYANSVVRTKRDEHGVTISSITAPWLQAAMLEQAAVVPGMRCLEVGSSGYNAALLAELAGPSGEVTTIDIDADIVDRARTSLERAGYPSIHVVHGDAEYGVPDHAPYHRILVTVGVADVPPTWVEQLAPDGRIVVPLRMRGLSRSVSLRPEGDHLVSVDHAMAGFVDVQGVGALRESLVLLHDEDVALRLDEPRVVDADQLGQALLAPRTATWSGVRFGAQEPFDELFLWLATALDDFCLLSHARTPAARRLVDPASSIGTPTLVGPDSFAYLTFRKIAPPSDEYEFGVYGHGPAAPRLADAMCDEIRSWSRSRGASEHAHIAVYPAATPASQLPAGRVVRRRHTTIVITWA
jgi:protein-L-isoaspartate(D-aspartate) O-methyltransferase